MKKIFFLLVILTSLNAYSQIRIGLNGGILFPINHYSDDKPSPVASTQTGIEVFLPLSEKFSIKTGVDYTSYAFKIQHSYMDNAGNKIGIAAEHYSARYLGIPIGVRYQFKGKFAPFLEAGFSAMFNVSKKSRVDDNPHGFAASNPTPNSFFISPNVGAGLNLEASEHLYLSFLVNYKMPLDNVYSWYGGQKFNAIGTYLSVGYKF